MFQVWRTVNETKDTTLSHFKLVWELQVYPSVVYAREDVRNKQTCISKTIMYNNDMNIHNSYSSM